MAYYDELSFEEAGAALGVTTGTFKSRVYRAKQYLVRHTHRSPRGSHPLRIAHAVFSRQEFVYRPCRRSRANPVFRSCVRMTNRTNATRVSGVPDAGD